MLSVDEHFIEKLRNNDKAAYKALLEHCKQVALSLANDETTAEDIAQSALEKIIKGLPLF